MSSPLLECLRNIVGNGALLTDPEEICAYTIHHTDLEAAAPLAVVLPKTTEEVRDILLLCNELKIPVIPSGGRTGLSGGATATGGEVVISMERMNRILSFSDLDRTLWVEAGVITRQIQDFAASHELFYPVDFASSASSQIGGNVATNAGGIHMIRYGGTRERVLGLRVVTGAGQILDLNRGLVKNNSGPDLRHLFIASEGILGVVCEVALALEKPPPASQVMVVAVERLAHLLEVLALARRQLTLSAFEFFSHAAVEMVNAQFGVLPPFSRPMPYYGLLEFDAADDQLSMDFFQSCQSKGWIVDAVISRSTPQAQNLWRLREDISASLKPYQPIKHDIALTLAKMPDFILAIEKLLSQRFAEFECIWFGHLGDGNIHLNVLKPEGMTAGGFTALGGAISEEILTVVGDFNGSISAEHGIGLLKKPYLQHGLSVEEIDLLRQLKKVFDPRGIMNPGKVIDSH